MFLCRKNSLKLTPIQNWNIGVIQHKIISEIKIKHSYLNRILSYNEWRISVEFVEEPNVLFWFTYRDGKIIFQGVSSEPMLDKESILDYSERFKNGTLLK